MIRTQLYIPKILHRQLNIIASRKNVTIARVVRDLLERGIQKEAKKQKNDLDQLTNLGITGGPKDLSEKMDKYLYSKEV